MNIYIKKLKDHMNTWQPNYGLPEIETLLEYLWYSYTEDNPVYNDEIRRGFKNVDSVLDSLSFEQSNLMFSEVCHLCQEHERLAFIEGIHIGAALVAELSGMVFTEEKL